MIDFNFDFVNCEHVNYLWPDLVERLGSAKAQVAVRQAIDLQLMQGNKNTLPVLNILDLVQLVNIILG